MPPLFPALSLPSALVPPVGFAPALRALAFRTCPSPGGHQRTAEAQGSPGPPKEQRQSEGRGKKRMYASVATETAQAPATPRPRPGFPPSILHNVPARMRDGGDDSDGGRQQGAFRGTHTLPPPFPACFRAGPAQGQFDRTCLPRRAWCFMHIHAQVPWHTHKYVRRPLRAHTRRSGAARVPSRSPGSADPSNLRVPPGPHHIAVLLASVP